MATWNGTSWSALGSGLNEFIYAATVYDSKLFVGGTFSTAGDKTSVHIAEWGCECGCHADPVCDGIQSNVQDVVATVNVAFRGAAAIPDPNGACPHESTDMNCDTFTSVIDVVKVVNVAFRGASAASEFCNPCP